MDGLDEFEKALAAEKMEREESGADKEKHHHHHRSSRDHRSRDDDKDRDRNRDRSRDRNRDRDSDRDRDHDRHRHKRRHSGERKDDEEDRRRKRSAKPSLSKEDTPVQDEEERPKRQREASVKRDSWMTDPTAMDFDYTQRGAKKIDTATIGNSMREEHNLKLHKNELNHQLHDVREDEVVEDIADEDAQHEVAYTFGDSGAQWRMTKLKAVYTQAEQSKKLVEEVAIERFGSLREFDDAREEEVELERRKLYGPGYVGKEKPSGELFQERKMEMGIRRQRKELDDDDTDRSLPQGEVLNSEPAAPKVDQTTLNRMKAQMMKAKLKGLADASRLEEEYNKAAANFIKQGPEVIVLGEMENRLLAGTRGEVISIDNKRGRERGLVKENEDMTIEDMVREERRTKGQAGGVSRRFAERIAKDAKFEDSLDYMDDNTANLSKTVPKSEINLKNMAVSEFQKMNRILENCQLCHHEDKNQAPIAPIISLGTRVYLTLPTEPELSEGGAVIVPIQHRTNLLECDDDEWEEIRNFMKCLTRMYHDQGRDVVFYENAAAPHRKMHAAMQAVPLPYSLGETAPAFFKEAILSSDEEWTQHKKLIDTAARARDGLGKQAFRRTLAKEMPYFHVWFDMDGGLGHIVEDANRWPKGDLFAREIIGGMLDIEPDIIKRQGRWHRGSDSRLEGFKKRWRKFDWTRVLTDG
jgi:hypothetical protein